jgi:hypothetical protein
MNLLVRSTTRFLVALLFLVTGACLSANAQKCFDYDPPGPAVSLTGKLRSQVYPGPPNFESIKNGDSRETVIILTLVRPVCTNRSSDDPAENNIREVQLVVTHDADWKTIRQLKGKKAVVTGTLFHAMTGWHQTSVLIYVSNIRAATK